MSAPNIIHDEASVVGSPNFEAANRALAIGGRRIFIARDTVDRCTPVAAARSLKVGALLAIELSRR